MAECSDGGTDADTKMDNLFCFEVHIKPKSRDKKKPEKTSLSEELKFWLNPNELQKHLLQISLLKNFVITEISELSDKEFVIIFAVRSLEDWNRFKINYQNYLPLGIKSYLAENKIALSGVGAVSFLEITAKMPDSKTLSKKAESFFQLRIDHSLDSNNDRQDVPNRDQPKVKKEKVMQDEKEDSVQQSHMKGRTFGIYYPTSDVSKILEISVEINTTKVLRKAKNHSVWLGKCYLPADLNHFNYTVCIKYEVSEGLLANITKGIMGSKVKEDKITFQHKDNDPFHIFQILFLKDYSKERAKAYAEICSVILSLTTEWNLEESFEILQSLQNREKIFDMDFKDVIGEVQTQLIGARFEMHIFYMFLGFLANLLKGMNYSFHEKCVRTDVTELIFQHCHKANMKVFPTTLSNRIPDVLMSLYVGSYKDVGSFLDFMFYAYPLVTEESLLGMVRNVILKQPELKIFNEKFQHESSQTQETLFRLAQRILNSLSDRHGNTLLSLLLRHIPFQELLHFMTGLRSNTSASNLANVCVETFISKVHMQIKSLKRVDDLCALWMNIRVFDFSQENTEAIVQKIEDAVLNTIRNVSPNDRMKYLKPCLEDGNFITMFQNTDQQAALLYLLVDSKNYELHKLALFVLNTERFQDIPPEKGKVVLEMWLDTAERHYCGKNVLAKSFIPKLYGFLMSAVVTKYVTRYTFIKEKLITMAFMELQNYSMEDIIGNIQEIENLNDPGLEEIYRDHVENLLRKAHDGKTINILIGDIKSKDILRINSRITYGVCTTLMSISGISKKMKKSDAFQMIVNQAEFWTSLFLSEGKKKSDLIKEILFCKARGIVIEIADDILKERVSFLILDICEQKTKKCKDLFESTCEYDYHTVQQAMEKHLKFMKDARLHLDKSIKVIEDVMKHISSDNIQKSLLTTQGFLVKQKCDFTSEEHSIRNIKDAMIFKTWLPSITQPIRCIECVVKSTFFWNCIKLEKNLENEDLACPSDDFIVAQEISPVEDIKFLFEEFDVEQLIPFDAFAVTKQLVSFLRKDGIDIYRNTWERVCKGDVNMIYVQKVFMNTDIDKELNIARDFVYVIEGKQEESLRNVLNFDEHEEKVKVMKDTVQAFKINVASDSKFHNALVAFDLLCSRKADSLLLKEVNTAIETVQEVTKHISDEVFSVVVELRQSSSLIDFLREVLNDDIRNLIDAVEEHSEQFVRESTVSGLIEVKRILYPVLKDDLAYDIHRFFTLLGKSVDNGGVKNIPGKIRDCMDNIHSLKSLYYNVTNKGENTQEVIEQILTKGVFCVWLAKEEPEINAEYKISGKTCKHSKARLSDLRSRALLIMNTKEKQRSSSGSAPRKSENLVRFVKMIDTVLDISNTCFLLRRAGHFDFLSYEMKMKLSDVDSVCFDLHNKLDEWLKMVKDCREAYYYMNFIHSSQLQIIHDFFRNGNHSSSVLNILKFINPHTSEKTVNELLQNFKFKPPIVDSWSVLNCIGAVIQEKYEKMHPVIRKFKFERNTKRLTDVVQGGKLHVVVEENNHLLLQTMLAVYLNTTALLPEANQVLFCNNETTEDDIILLLNRCVAAHKNGLEKRLFSIVNIELLSTELCFKIVEKLHQLPSTVPFLLVVIIGGNQRSALLEEFADKVKPIRSLTDNEMKQCFENQWPHVYTITSDIPGLGKTETVYKMASQARKGVNTLHLSGPFVKSNIVKILSEQKIRPYHLFHLDIAVVSDPHALDLFLFELVAFGYVSAGSASFGASTEHVCIEIANSVQNTLMNSLSTASHFKRQNLVWKNYDNMKISGEISSPVQVVCNYLMSLKQNELDRKDKYFTGVQKEKSLSETQCRTLLKEYFSPSSEMSFTLVNIFINVLADQLKKMSTSVYFRQSNITSMLGDKQIPTIKTNLTAALIDVSKEFATRSIHTCRSTQKAALSSDENKHENKAIPSIENLTAAAVLAKRVEGMIQWEDSNHLIVLFHQDLNTVSALFRNKSKVPKTVTAFFENQLKKPLTDLEKWSSNDLQSILLKLTRHSGEHIKPNELQKLDKTYALTPDNLLKMVLVSLRVKSYIPVIIMGETGCGKTSLIRYLSVMSGVEFNVLSIHAGVTSSAIIERVREASRTATKTLNAQYWLFLDEINTCDHLGLICDIICHHKCMGMALPPNLVVLAACNPYRLRTENAVFSAGLQGKVQQDELSRLVYRVHPLPESMIDFVWDYGRLGDSDEKKYIERMIGNILQNTKLSNLFVDLLSASQRFVRHTEKTDYSVSLRDVERCRRLLSWFIRVLQTKSNVQNQALLKERAIILAVGLCYHSRIPDSGRRHGLRNVISKVFHEHNFYYTDDDIWDTIKNEQNDILERMELPEGIAKNIALQENVFVILVCILNRIPVFVVGKPGCSKSLSMQLIRSNLRGKDSRDNFFKTLPQLYCVSFQGSESSTSDGIIKVFDKAKRYQAHDNTQETLSVVILDEIGLAEISRFNPLKVLHSLLEPEEGILPDVAVVGISNWALDAAKMNRAIHLSRPEMTEDELYETGVSIGHSLLKKTKQYFATYQSSKYDNLPEETKEMLRCIAHAYSVYVKIQTFQNFHGLRDYYSLIKHICRSLTSVDNSSEIDEVLTHGLLRNFGGLPPSEAESLRKVFRDNFANASFKQHIPVDILVNANLKDNLCRHLMLITSGDAVISNLQQSLKSEGKEYEVMFGSQFEEDLTDDYNYRILSRIILCMEQGLVLILKDLENIYGSLYDMLNQNYTVVGNKKNCRIALGPYSNPMCHVHDEFKCIVFVESSKLDYSDPPFLNRFEKQQFRFKDLLNENDFKVIKELKDFMISISQTQKALFQKERCFPIYSEDVLSSLVLKVHSEFTLSKTEEVFDFSCKQLLLIMFPDAAMRAEISTFAKENPSRFRDYKKYYLLLPIHEGLSGFVTNMCCDDSSAEPTEFSDEIPGSSEAVHELGLKQYQTEEMILSAFTLNEMFIIFTHSNVHTNIHNCLPKQNIQLDKIGSFKSEKNLTERLNKFFVSDRRILVIQFDGSRDLAHFQFVKYAVENIKGTRDKSEVKSSKKIVIILIHLSKDNPDEMNMSSVNFMPGWVIATIDELETPKVSLPDIIRMTLPEAIELHYDLNDYIKQQLFWAFTRIRYTSDFAIEGIERHIEQIGQSKDLLCTISEFISSWIANNGTIENRQWQMHVACNAQLLQCSSSYMNAIENHIQEIIKQPLAMFIFRLEESGALESFFIEDENINGRRVVWKDMIKDKTFFDYEKTPTPSGPECYSCSIPFLKRRMPFSNTIFLRTESLKDAYLEMLRKVKVGCDLGEEEEVPRNLLDDIIIGYQDIVTANLPEISFINYDDMTTDYFHDFANFITSTVVPTMDEKGRIMAMQWALLNYLETTDCDFPTFLTNLHLSLWTYSEKIIAVVNTFHVSEKAIASSVEQIVDNLKCFESSISEKDMPSVLSENENKSPLQSELETTSCKVGCSDQEAMKEIANTYDSNTEDIEKMPYEFALTKETMQSCISPDLSTQECIMKETIEFDGECVTQEKRLLHHIGRKLLPTTEHMISSTVLMWQHNVKRFLPLAGAISYDVDVVQSLRFCNDFATIITKFSSHEVEDFTAIGDSLASSELVNEDFYQDFLTIAKAQTISLYEIQRTICLYAYRCLAIQDDLNVIEWLINSIEEGEMPDENLSFLGPILRIAIEDQERDVILCILKDDAVHYLEEECVLKSLNHCILSLPTTTKSYVSLISLLIDIFETVVFLKDEEDSLFTSEYFDAFPLTDLALQANKILKSGDRSLQNVIAVAFLRQFFGQLACVNITDALEFQHICSTANAIFELNYNEETQTPNSMLLLFLKTLGLERGVLSIKKRCSLSCSHFPLLAKLTWNEHALLTAMDLHPYPAHDHETYQKFENAVSVAQEKEEIIKKLVKDSLSDPNHLICVHAIFLSKIILKRAVGKVSDSDKQFVEKLLHFINIKAFPPVQGNILHLFSGKRDFHSPVFYLSPDSEEPDLHIVSFLCHLLSTITAFGTAGDMMYDCICNPNNCKKACIPGLSASKSWICIRQKLVLCSCKTKYVSSRSSCPICDQKEDEISCTTEHSVTISMQECYEIEFLFLQLFIYGCFVSSIAINEHHTDSLKEFICQEDKVYDTLLDKLKNDWNYLRAGLDVSHSDFCCLLHIFIIEYRKLLANGPMSRCNNVQQRNAFEDEFVKSMGRILRCRRDLLVKYKGQSFKFRGLQNSKEYLLEEINKAETDIHETLFFNITGTPTKENLYAQLLLQPSDQYPFLRLVHRKKQELSAFRYIWPLLKWHLGVVTMESYKIKRVDCKGESVLTFLSREKNEKVRHILMKLFENFKKAWNELAQDEDAIGILKSQDWSFVELQLITSDTKANICLADDPSSNIKHTLLRLVDIHNSFLDDVLLLSESQDFPGFDALSYAKYETFIRCVSLADISKNEIIHFQWDDVYLRYSQISTDIANKRDVAYDFRKIEMELAHKILFGKVYITDVNALPEMVFRDELFRNCTILLEQVHLKIPQQPLSPEVLKGLQKKKEHNPSHTHDILTQIGIILSLLNKTGGDPTVPIIDYLEKWNGIIAESSYKHLLPEPEHCLKLCHAASLYEFLEEINGGDICESLDIRFRTQLVQEISQKLQSMQAKNIKIIEHVGKALKVYVHRNLSEVDLDIDVDKCLLDYLIDPVYWKQGSFVDGYLTIDMSSTKIPIQEIISPLSCVKHIYWMLQFIKDALEDEKEKDLRISSITAGYQNTRRQTAGKNPKKAGRRILGKT